MTTERLYKKAERADDMADLDLKDADRSELLKAGYHAWLKNPFRKDYYFGNIRGEDNINGMYREACKIIRPFKESIGGELRTEDLLFLDKKDAGFYLSAVLNETDVTKMSIGRFPKISKQLEGLGLYLKDGKTIELRKDAYIMDIGDWAKGGLVINRGHLGSNMGLEARGGIFVNHGKAGWMGTMARGGVFIDFGDLYLMGFGGHSSIGVTMNGRASSGSDSGMHFVGPEELKNDGELGWLYREVEGASAEERFDDVKTLARKVDAHVRKNYQPRKVA